MNQPRPHPPNKVGMASSTDSKASPPHSYRRRPHVDSILLQHLCVRLPFPTSTTIDRQDVSFAFQGSDSGDDEID